ncbi:MAG TPA: hypothetical protein VIV40_39900 [Kofleriaceae bacterium]
MRSAVVVVGLVIASVVPGHAAPRPAPRADFPLLGEVDGARARIVVRGEVAKGKHEQLVKLVRDVVADVERRFTRAAKQPDDGVTLLLFSDQGRYREVAETFGPLISEWGFYLPDRRVAIANTGASIGNLRHELVHPLIGDDFPAIPTWLNEGVAALYGSAKLGKRGFTFLVNYRLRDLKRALANDTCPSLRELAESTDADVHGERAMVYYALSRYVLLFADRKGTLSRLYADLRDSPRDKHAEVLARYVDETAFRRWARQLR